MFVHTEVVIGGRKPFWWKLFRRMDRQRFQPELCCLKRLAALGEVLAGEVPTFVGLLKNKYDLRVLGRLTWPLVVAADRRGGHRGHGRRSDVLGALGGMGSARTPVIVSALHATGYPMWSSRLNRLLRQA